METRASVIPDGPPTEGLPIPMPIPTKRERSRSFTMGSSRTIFLSRRNSRRRAASSISETDTEIIAHLIDERINEGCSFPDAVRGALGQIKGSYALGILYEGAEGCFIVAKKESPLVIGLAEGEFFVASDVPPILSYTRDFLFMEDGEMALLSTEGVKVFNASGEAIAKD